MAIANKKEIMDSIVVNETPKGVFMNLRQSTTNSTLEGVDFVTNSTGYRLSDSLSEEDYPLLKEKIAEAIVREQIALLTASLA